MAAASGDPIEDLSHLPPELLDALPFGAIQLSGDGTITAYNRGESALSGLAPKDVIGKNFFRDVAPCTAVQEFGGRFQALCAGGDAGFVGRILHAVSDPLAEQKGDGNQGRRDYDGNHRLDHHGEVSIRIGGWHSIVGWRS